MINFATESWIVNQEVASFLFILEINSSDITVVIYNRVDVDLEHVSIDFSETFNQLLLELFLRKFFWFA